jgi:hypothetical protein
MKTSTFLQTLRAHRALPVVFRHGSDAVPAGWHLTEAKRVTYETMDCGAMLHRWAETQFEIWVPPLNGVNPLRGHMAADKFLRIIDHVEKELPLAGDAEARIHTVLGDGPPALWDIESAAPSAGQLIVSLTPDRTRCKAAERRVCNLTSGKCGDNVKDDAPCCSGESSPAGSDAESACCGPSTAQAEKAACCT